MAACAGVMLIASLLGNRQGPPLLPPPASPAEDDSDFLAVVSGQHSTSSGQPAAPELEAPLLLPAPSSPSPPQEKEPPPLICQGLPSAREVMATVAAAIHRAAAVVGCCALVCTFVSAVCAHMPKSW